MTIKRNKLRSAISIALTVGAASMVSMGAAYAQDATPAPAPTDSKAKQLDTITVTGSRVRRVEQETASPVIVLDRKALEETGKLTIGEIVNELPAISGAVLTTEVNNGGGTGAATADLRGVGSIRTLVLIDGHRPAPTAVDLNSIPLAMVERVEVLTTGASTIYGSDAIGGVINFIMKKNYNGAEFESSYGESGHHDSDRKGDTFVFGQSGDKGNVVMGVEYNKFDAVPAGNRGFSRNASSLYKGQLYIGGSGSTPYGQIKLTPGSAIANSFNCTASGGAGGPGDVTLKAGTPPGVSNTSDYRCFTGADNFNYQPQNIIMAPQERTNAFAMANYNLTDDITAYMNVYEQKQTSEFQIAPLPITTSADGIFISKNNMYNPFGEDFGPSASEFRTRISPVGQRISNNSTSNDTLIGGLKGSFGQTWSWDATFDYNHEFLVSSPTGYINAGSLATALGPSMLVNGVPTCVATPGLASSAIAGCTPLNIFNEFDPATIAAIKAAQVSPIDTSSTIQRELEFNTSGDLFDLPAGAVKLALGMDKTTDYVNDRVDPIALVTNPLTGQCGTSQELCASPLIGSFQDKEAYAELFVPILKDVPGAYALNLDVGTRYSKYNIFSGNDSSKVALEWRPIKDLLIRGSASDIFRAPNPVELFAAASGGAFPFPGDPCAGLSPNGAGQFISASGANVTGACGSPRGTVNSQVPPGGIQDNTTAGQTTGVAEGSQEAGFPIKPEQGKSYDFGFVYDPEFVPGLSMNADYYRITLNDLIATLSPETAMNACVANAASVYCQYIHRNANGSLAPFVLPTVNAGSLATEGFDFAVKYKLPVMSVGQFSVSSDFTHIDKYNIASPNNPVLNLAGRFLNGVIGTGTNGNFFKWRGDLSLDWSKGDWNGGWRIQWVGAGNDGSTDLSQSSSADLGVPGVAYHIGNYFDNYLTAGYKFGAIGPMDARVDVGVDNVFDRQAPFFPTNTVTNANTDVSTYDTIGRLFWARFSAKF